MSTISLSYPTVNRTRRTPLLGMILVLSLLTVLSIIALGVAASTEKTSGLTDVQQSSIASIAIPTPGPAIATGQAAPTETALRNLEEMGKPSVLPVPVPTPASSQTRTQNELQ